MKRISLVLFALLLINAGSARCEEASIKTRLSEEFRWLREEAFDMQVVTASKKAQKISEAPATMITITQEQIEAYGWRDLKDVFKAIPGVDVSYNVQGELKTSVIMRGISGNQKILILQDGHKYSPESGERFLYAYNMPLNIYKRIEIIYGPASGMYGADAYAGVINLITKDGADYNGNQVSAGYLSTGAYTADAAFGKKIDDDTDLVMSARRNFENFGLFVQTEYKIFENLKLDAGLRYDYNSVYKETFNPRIGMIIDPMKNLNIKLLYGTAYIQPSNFYRYENFANPFLLHIPNESLEPEKLKNYSVDVSYTFGEHYAVHLAAYINKMENIIRAVQAPAQAGNYPYYNPYWKTPGFTEYNGNQGDIDSKGGEITLKHKFDRLLSSLSYSYVSGEDDGFEVAEISHHKITLNSSYTAEKWIAAMTLRYYSEVSTDKNNYQYGSPEKGGDGSYHFDGALIAYLNFIYRFNKKLSANLSVDNVFDTKHYAGVPFDGSPVVVPRTPQPLQQIFAGVKYSF